MQIVIDIDEDYVKIINKNGASNYPEEVIKNGIPLPKGHGNLIDANELLISERPKGIADDVWKESHIYKLLSNAQTVIEADKDGN